ncbi:MAG: four helix bundle protein [Akkermansiaceae bacterium]
MAYQSFEELDVWKDACRLAVSIHELFQSSKDFAMRDQIIRSSVSVPSNIAEGMERGSTKDTIRFLHIAKGSCAEVRTQLYLSSKMNIIPTDQTNPLLNQTRKISGQLQNLITALNRRNSNS